MKGREIHTLPQNRERKKLREKERERGGGGGGWYRVESCKYVRVKQPGVQPYHVNSDKVEFLVSTNETNTTHAAVPIYKTLVVALFFKGK